MTRGESSATEQKLWKRGQRYGGHFGGKMFTNNGKTRRNFTFNSILAESGSKQRTNGGDTKKIWL